MSSSIEMVGYAGVYKKIKELSSKAREVMGNALYEGAVKIKERAQELVPRDTGRLQQSITAEKVDDSISKVGTDVSYAPYVELGTEKMSAQPYLFPAFEQLRDEVLENVKNKINGVVDE